LSDSEQQASGPKVNVSTVILVSITILALAFALTMGIAVGAFLCTK